MNAEAEKIITLLNLAPLPQEGGFFRQTWTSREQLPRGRSAGSAIYFLLTEQDFSALHRLQTFEVWCFHAGDTVEHVQLFTGDDVPLVSTLGNDVLAGQSPQLIVSGGAWQGARLAGRGPKGWALLSCTMAPAWDEREFELGDRAALSAEFPFAASWIYALTR